MTEQEIHAILDKMLANHKSKNFLNHLVRAYLPLTNVQKIEVKPTGEFKCVLTKTPLVSIDEIFAVIDTEEYMVSFREYMGNLLSDDVDKTHPMVKMVGDKKLGVTGKDTTTFMSYGAFQSFYNWVITKSMTNDKHINWLLGDIRRSSFIKRAETIDNADVQTKAAKIKKAAKPNKANQSTFTLGDSSDVLSKLKEKLDEDGK